MLTLALALLAQDPGTWVKRTPVEGTPKSPRLGYEGDVVWHSQGNVLLRYGGHNPGGGGEQHSEVWVCDPRTWTWTLKEPDVSPPGVCCAQQNAYDPVRGRYVRFPSFSGSHGWQWRREIDLNQSSVWTYDLAANRWRDLRPLPAPALAPLRSTAWDADHDVIVIFGGEGSREGTLVYDPYVNTWTRMKPPKEPDFRSGGNLAYDQERKVHVLFGSQFTNDPGTWAYDLRKNAWRDLAPPASPPTDKNDAVLAYDPGNKLIVAIVKVADALETWHFDGTTWTKPEIKEPDQSGSRARVLAYAPELGVLLENCPSKPREQQVWTYRPGPGRPLAPRVRSVRVSGATVTWDPPVEAKVRKAVADVPWKADYREIGAGTGSFTDPDPAGMAFYEVEGVRARAQPRLVEDVVVSVLAAGKVEVAWAAVEEAVEYQVERAAVEVLSDDQLKPLKSRTPPLEEPQVGTLKKIGTFERVATVKGCAWEDVGVDLAKPTSVVGEPVWQRTVSKDALDPDGKAYRFGVYAYRVRAVNARGVAGGPSPATLTIPSPVRNLFSKEDGGTARLRWEANPEKSLRGYRVYRLDGRFDKEPITRLTGDPVAERLYADPGAGKKSRRYHVVAVDLLGQEGRPSSPVWFEREWKSTYAPFVGEWHQ